VAAQWLKESAIGCQDSGGAGGTTSFSMKHEMWQRELNRGLLSVSGSKVGREGGGERGE